MNEYKTKGAFLKRKFLPAVLLLCLVMTAAACGSSSGSKSEEPAGQTEGLILYVGSGQFVISGYSNDYPGTVVYLTLNDEDKGYIGGMKTEGDSFMMIVSNAEEVTETETEGYQKVELRAYGVNDVDTEDGKTEDALSKVFYVKCPGDAHFLLESVLATDEKATPPDWEWK